MISSPTRSFRNGLEVQKAKPPSRIKSVWMALTGRVGMAPLQQAFIQPSAAGKSVTGESALQLATVWACIRILSQTVATLPLILYTVADDEELSPAKSDPLYKILKNSPHADYTAVEFWEGVTLCLCLWGNAYCRKEYIGPRLVALTPLRVDLMAVKRNQAGARVYHYSSPEGLKIYSEDEIFHVRGFGGASDVGLSPVAYARQSMGTAMAADELAGTMFKNGTRPTGVLTIEQVLTPEQRNQMRNSIVAPMAGAENAGGIFVLEAGMKFQPITMTPEDSQFLETRAFHVEEMCRWFGVPPSLIGHTSKSTSWGTGLEQQMLFFLNFGLRPFLVRIEQAIERSLIPAAKRDGLQPKFKAEGLLRTDSQARAAFYAIMIQNGIMTANEIRRLENLPAMDGGDVLRAQVQNQPIGSTAPASIPPADPAAGNSGDA